MYQKVVLDRKVNILIENIPHVRSVAIGFWVNVGSRDEIADINGISHFIEHMMFKGTQKRTAKEIAEALDAVGGFLNAFTTKEYTCYYARVLDEHFDLAAEILSDMIFQPQFNQRDIEKEKNVIIEEIKMYEDTPDELVHDVFAGSMWQEHALGLPVIGSAEVIAGLSRKQLCEFYKKHYTPRNMIISVAGNIEPEKVVDKLKNILDLKKDKVLARKMITPLSCKKTNCCNKKTEQVHLCIGTPGFSLDNKNIYTFQVINTILGGGISSRLFQEIREQRGLVYSVFSYHASYHDTGLFCIYAGLSKQNVEQVLDIIFKQIRDIQLNGLKDDELRRAKDQIKGNLYLSLESVSARMSRLGKSQIYLGKVLHPEEIVHKVSEVTPDKIQELALSALKPECFTMATVGPWEDGNIFQKVIKQF
jgi:predicted Zn-dependent peptidase